MRIRSVLLIFVAALACNLVAYADTYQYAFTYTAGASGVNQIQSFSFSFMTNPTLITAPPNSQPAFTPFTITDGNGNSWTITNDLVGLDGFGHGCFGFGTSQVTLVDGGCGGIVPVGNVAFSLFTPGGLPVNPQFPGSQFSGEVSTQQGAVNMSGTMFLAITDLSTTPVPEPSPLVLLGTGLLGGLGAMWRRFPK